MQITIGASVLLAAAAILLFMFNDQSQGFGNFLDTQSKNAQCDLSLNKWKSACSSPQDIPKADSIYSGADSDCDWKSDGSTGKGCTGAAGY